MYQGSSDDVPPSSDAHFPTVAPPDSAQLLYFRAEGFGETYRRVMMNRYFSNLLAQSQVRSVTEYPVDSYGVDGAGSLIFALHGCDVTFVSDRADALDRTAELYVERGLANVRYLLADLERTSLPDNAFDLSWSFDRIQALPDPAAALREMARISKMVFVTTSNACNYGQYVHWAFHKLARNTCDYVGPRRWMRHGPVRAVLQGAGLEIVDQSVIDVPWWPGFPELPNLVRRALRRPEPPAPTHRTVAYPDNRAVEGTARRSAFIEDSDLPWSIRFAFAHNLYMLAIKPAYRSMLGAGFRARNTYTARG